LSPPHDEWASANLSVKKQLDFADSDVEILDLGDLATHHTPSDDTDSYVDYITTIYDWPKTHSFSTPTVAAHLGPLLSAQAAFDAAALADKFQLIPPSYTAAESHHIDGSPVQDEPDGSTVSLDLPTASDIPTGTVDMSVATGTTGTGDTDLGLAAAASGTETTHGDGEAGTDADAPTGTTFIPPSTDSTVESVESASATVPGESVYAEPTSATVTAETPAPVSSTGATGESGASATDPSPTPATTVESGTVSVELGVVSAPTSASPDAVSIDLGPPSSVVGTLSVDPTAPVLATAAVPSAATLSSPSVALPAATYNS